jgi:chromosome segregation ATPase
MLSKWVWIGGGTLAFLLVVLLGTGVWGRSQRAGRLRAEAEAARLKEQRDEKDREAAAAVEMQEGLRKSLQAAQKLTQQLEDRFREMDREAEEAQQRLQAKETELKGHAVKSTELAAAKQAAEIRANTLGDKVRKTEHLVETREEEMDRVKREAAEAKRAGEQKARDGQARQAEALKQAEGRFDADRQALLRVQKQLQDQLRTSQDQLRASQAEVQRLRDVGQKVWDDYQKTRADLAQREKDLDQLRKQMDDLRKQINDLRNELGRVRK